MSTIQSIDQIAIDSAVRGGRPHIIGTSITVSDVAIGKVFRMMDAEAIAEWYDIKLPQVYAALAYYYDHKEAVDGSILKRRELAAEMKEKRVGSKHPPLFG